MYNIQESLSGKRMIFWQAQLLRRDKENLRKNTASPVEMFSQCQQAKAARSQTDDSDFKIPTATYPVCSKWKIEEGTDPTIDDFVSASQPMLGYPNVTLH